MKNENDLTPKDVIQLYSLELLIKEKQSKDDILFFLLNKFECKVAKSRSKKRLLWLFELIENKEKLEFNNNKNNKK